MHFLPVFFFFFLFETRDHAHIDTEHRLALGMLTTLRAPGVGEAHSCVRGSLNNPGVAPSRSQRVASEARVQEGCDLWRHDLDLRLIPQGLFL